MVPLHSVDEVDTSVAEQHPVSGCRICSMLLGSLSRPLDVVYLGCASMYVSAVHLQVFLC